MKRLLWLAAVVVWCASQGAVAQESFTLEQVMKAPFPSNLVAAKTGNRIAWAVNQEGKRNIWVAEGPQFAARQVTSYQQDDGEELSELHFSADGNAIVYVRGLGKNSAGEYPNPTHNPAGVQQSVWVVSWTGGSPTKIDEGDSVALSAQGRVVYQRAGQMWLASAKAGEKPRQIAVRGQNTPVDWSADGRRLLFVSDRGDHSFVGIFDVNNDTVRFISPTVDSDKDPEWSPDGKHIAFVRQPAVPRDTPRGYFVEPDRPHPWAIWVADGETGEAREIWHSGAELQDSFPYMAEDTGGGVINWAAGDRIVYASEADGWQHLYAISASGGASKLLTPGNCEVEQWSFSPDKQTIIFNSSCGDTDRRHLWRVSTAEGSAERVTDGKGIEWSPIILGDANMFAYLGSDGANPGRPHVGTFPRGALLGLVRPLDSLSWPEDFPADKLATPQAVTFASTEGLEIHGQLFLRKTLKSGEKRPAMIFFHGGPMRQMLLGWHYMYYYSNCYAMNQYLANRGYIVLSVNYRSGIGYGRAFREVPGRAGRGASEYQDVVAAGKYLQSRDDVDAKRIGLWGGSYGGLLTALGLGRNSDMFAAGVDLHGVHDWPADNWEGKHIPPELVKLAHDSSPVTAVNTWKSPVLFIHGDDDRNVMFAQTVDLAARLRAKGVEVEELVFPDEIHDFLLYRTWLKAYQAGSDFFDRKLGGPQK